MSGEPKSKQGVRIKETVSLTGMKRAVAEHMVMSHQQVPSVTVFADLEMDALLTFKREMLDAAAAEAGIRLTLTPIVIKAVAVALQRFPLLNATIGEDGIQLLDEVNIGMAVALPDGNLIVPVIRNAGSMTIIEVAQESNRLAAAAVAGKVSLNDVRGGTFTVSNVGSVPGTLWQTPLVNHPQSGILALGRVREAPVVRDGQLGVGRLMGASLSFDHRVISGLPASEFMACLAELLRMPEMVHAAD